MSDQRRAARNTGYLHSLRIRFHCLHGYLTNLCVRYDSRNYRAFQFSRLLVHLFEVFLSPVENCTAFAFHPLLRPHDLWLHSGHHEQLKWALKIYTIRNFWNFHCKTNAGCGEYFRQYNNNNIFISYIKYTNITPPANSKANRGRWCEDGLRFITIVEVKKSTIFIIKRVSHERNWNKKISGGY